MMSLQNSLGELQSVWKPPVFQILFTPLISLPLMLLASLCGLLIFEAFTVPQSAGGESALARASSPLVCSGVLFSLLFVLGIIWLEEFRKWKRTRKHVMRIYERGFTYETEARFSSCRWDEIAAIERTYIKVSSKAFPAIRKEKVVRSVVKTDGAIIDIAETLNRVKITEQIDSLRT